jgi:hypothetical protein
MGLGVPFGVACGAATGVTVAIELARMSRTQDHYALRWESVFSAIRGVAFGAGLGGSSDFDSARPSES